MKKTIVLLFAIALCSLDLTAQRLTPEDIIGTWKVRNIHPLEDMPDENRKKMDALKVAFLKSKIEFKEDKNFSFDFEFDEMRIENAHWKYNSETESYYVQEWKDKDTSNRILMEILADRQGDKIFFLLSETSLVMDMKKVGEQSENQAEWLSLEQDNFQIDYPNDWDVDTSGLMGTSFFLFSPVSGENDQFRENLSLITQDLSANNLTLDKYVELSEKQISTLITDGKIILSERVKNENKEFQKVIYTGKQGVFDLEYEQYYWIENNIAYILTFTCEISELDEYQVIGEKIMDSFKLR